MSEVQIPHYLKVEFSYETFCKLKWDKAKNVITIS